VKTYIKKPQIQGAWKWILEGYKSAWADLGFKVEYYDRLSSLSSLNDEYILMVRDWDIETIKDLEVINNSKKTYFFAQPNTFPHPWGRHPNFISHCKDEIIDNLNAMNNVHLWSFCDVGETQQKQFYQKWKKVNTIPLAFDSSRYTPIKTDKMLYDVCYIGGWANNGFDEKRQIMIKTFSAFKNTDLKCGFFINKNLSHEQEISILHNSKICLNIHDNYQRQLGLDTNERTFKSLGLNGLLVSDKVTQLSNLFPEVNSTNDPQEMVKNCTDLLSLSDKKLTHLKQENIENILGNHCYTHRVEKLLEL